MSRDSIYTDIYTMLSDMTVANGYNATYTPVKSVSNDSIKITDVPTISVHLGYETEVTEGRAVNQYRAEVPVIFTARVRTSHANRNEIEYAEDVARSKAISDIKRRFSNAHTEITDCTIFEPFEEREYPIKDSNKNTLFVQYVFMMTYKQARKLPTPIPHEGD